MSVIGAASKMIAQRRHATNVSSLVLSYHRGLRLNLHLDPDTYATQGDTQSHKQRHAQRKSPFFAAESVYVFCDIHLTSHWSRLCSPAPSSCRLGNDLPAYGVAT